MKRAITLLVLSLLPLRGWRRAMVQYSGLATPTNSQGEWSFDEGVFGRSTSVGSQASIRELVGYGFTPHLTLSFTLPVVVGDTRAPAYQNSARRRFRFHSGMAISAQGNEGRYSHREHCLRWSRRSRPTVRIQRSGSHDRTFPASWFGAVTGHGVSQPLRVAWSHVHQVLRARREQAT